MLEKIEQAVNGNDATTARRELHSLKGMIGTFFASAPEKLVYEYEEEARDGTLERLNNGGIEEICNCVRQLCSCLSSEGLTHEQA